MSVTELVLAAGGVDKRQYLRDQSSTGAAASVWNDTEVHARWEVARTLITTPSCWSVLQAASAGDLWLAPRVGAVEVDQKGDPSQLECIRRSRQNNHEEYHELGVLRAEEQLEVEYQTSPGHNLLCMFTTSMVCQRSGFTASTKLTVDFWTVSSQRCTELVILRLGSPRAKPILVAAIEGGHLVRVVHPVRFREAVMMLSRTFFFC